MLSNYVIGLVKILNKESFRTGGFFPVKKMQNNIETFFVLGVSKFAFSFCFLNQSSIWNLETRLLQYQLNCSHSGMNDKANRQLSRWPTKSKHCFVAEGMQLLKIIIGGSLVNGNTRGLVLHIFSCQKCSINCLKCEISIIIRK